MHQPLNPTPRQPSPTADARPAHDPDPKLGVLRHVPISRRRFVERVVDTLAAEPPTKAWHLWALPLLLSIALVGMALLLSVIQALLEA